MIELEAIKMAWRQDKDGYVLTLRVHPNDAQRELMADAIGTIYQVSLRKDGQQDNPSINRGVQAAGILCRSPLFQAHLRDRYRRADIVDEASAVQLICDVVGVESRAEIKLSQTAQAKMMEIANGFRKWHASLNDRGGEEGVDEF